MTTRNARPPAMFIAGDPSLDFLNSIATPVDAVVEWLADGDDLVNWLTQARLLPSEATASIRNNCTPRELDAVASRARSLREWFRAFIVAHRGRPLRRNVMRELEPLNRILERDDTYGLVAARSAAAKGAGPGLEWRTLRRWRTPESLLFPIAHAIANFLTSEDLARVKACERSPCTLFFLDRTRAQARRWCSMTVCGNRAKQALYRSRVRQQKRGTYRKARA